MKQVVIVGPDFAPSSLPPATRIRFFANHLSKFGWRPIVLTVAPQYYDWPTDSDNLKLLPNSLKVVRTEAWRSSWTRKFGFGDIGMRSLWYQWQALKRLCRETKIDLIFIPVPPYMTMMLGRLAHEKFGIPYVIDYIDPWVTEYYWSVPRRHRPPKWPLSYAMSRLCEPYALKLVSHITGVSRGTTDGVLSRYEHLVEKDVTEIPYGAEGDDFEYLSRWPRQNPIFDRDDGFLHLSCVGACIPSMHATVRALFGAVRLGLERAPDLFGRLRLHFVGTSYAANGSPPHDVLALAREARIEARVSEQATRVPYLDSLQVMIDSHALFLVGSDEPHYTASKIFPYMLAGRPLLAIFHEASSVIKILSDVNAGRVVSFNEKETVAERVNEISVHIEEMLRENYVPQIRGEAFESYSTRVLAGRLAETFDAVIGR